MINLEDTPIYILKPYKNRNKSELYIHNKTIRYQLSIRPMKIVSEDLQSLVTLQKKIIFRSGVYGEIIKLALEAFDKSADKQQTAQLLSEMMEAKLREIPSHLDLSQEQVREGYYAHIIKALKKS